MRSEEAGVGGVAARALAARREEGCGHACGQSVKKRTARPRSRPSVARSGMKMPAAALACASAGQPGGMTTAPCAHACAKRKRREIAGPHISNLNLARVREHGGEVGLLGRSLGQVPLEGIIGVGGADFAHALRHGGARDEIDRLRAIDAAFFDDAAVRVACPP